MEHGGYSILKPLRVPDGLRHSLRYIQPLVALALDMYTGEAGQVRHLSIALHPARLHVVAVSLEYAGKLQLTRTALALACPTHWNLHSARC